MAIQWSIMFSQCYAVEKIFQNFRLRLKLSIQLAMEIKLFVTCEMQYFELGIFSFNQYVYYLSPRFIASTGTFNLVTCAFHHATRAFRFPACGFELVTCEFELVTHGFELVTREFELVTRGFELVTRTSCFTFLRKKSIPLPVVLL